FRRVLFRSRRGAATREHGRPSAGVVVADPAHPGEGPALGQWPRTPQRKRLLVAGERGDDGPEDRGVDLGRQVQRRPGSAPVAPPLAVQRVGWPHRTTTAGTGHRHAHGPYGATCGWRSTGIVRLRATGRPYSA